MIRDTRSEAQKIVAMTQTPGWEIVRSHIDERIRIRERDLLTQRFETQDDALKMKGIIHELKALKGLLQYIDNRLKDA